MPVLIFGEVAELDLIRPLAARLRADGGEVRCYLDDDDYELRNMGCKLAVGRLDDDVTLEGALTNVHTFIPVLPDPMRLADDAGLGWFEVLGMSAASAADKAKVSQTILPLPGLPNVGEVRSIKEVFTERCHPLCLIHTGMIWGPNRPLLQVLRGLAATNLSMGVVELQDWVDLIAAADDRESIDGAWEFSAPPVSVSILQNSAGAGKTLVSPMWLKDDVVVGNSAAAEFGVNAKRVAG